MSQAASLSDAGSPPASVVTVKGVSKTFHTGDGRETLALKDINLDLDPGAFVTLLGPSGCGKTTLLRLVDGLIAPDKGSISIFGAPPVPGPDIGLVFQSFRLIPWATTLANVEFALRSLNLPVPERKERALHYLDLVGLGKFSAAYPGELSGGMKQRVALTRALACEPRLLLMDEPFASIDAQTRELMQIELMRIWSKVKPVVLFVTHSVDEAIVLSDKIMLMGPRPGRVVDSFDVALERPRWTYDARAEPAYVELRSHLSNRMRELVLADPQSEFFGRDLAQDGA